MKTIFRFFAERHLLANLFTVMLVLLGLASAFRINRSEYPKVDLGEMSIHTSYPGASPEDVELNVTNKLEDELKGITGIKEMTSSSMENLSSIRIEIDPDEREQDKVKDEIREAVARVDDFPPEVTDSPRIRERKSTLWPILDIGMSGDLPYAELREHARNFEKKLKELPGVAQVRRSGYRAREVRIEVSPEKMMKYQIPIQEIIDAIQTRNIRASGGSLESYTSEKNVVTLAQFREPMEVGDVIVRSHPNGAIVRVEDLAIVSDDFEEAEQFTRINGKSTISFRVIKSERADIIRTTDAIKALVEEEKHYLPESVEFLYTDDESISIRNKFEIALSNGIIGLVLVLLVLTLFLNIRSAFWVAMGIPFTVFGVLILLPSFNVDLDSITLSSLILVIGIVVDDAIVICENIFRRREQGETVIEAAINGVHEVYLPVLTSVATTILAFFPMFFMKGMTGKFVFVIPLTIILALSTSLFEALFILPSHLLPGLKPKQHGKKQSLESNWFRPIRDRFERIAFTLVKFRYLWVMLAVLFLVASLWYAANSMQFILFPSKGSSAFYARLELPIGSSLEATLDKSKEIESILKEWPEGEIESYALHVGADNNEHTTSLEVYLSPYATRERNADEIVEALREQTARIDGIRSLTFWLDTGGPETGDPIEIRVIGANDRLRTKLVDDLVAFLGTLKGVKDLDRSDRGGKEEVRINLNHERLKRYGLTVANIAQNVRIAYDGEVVTRVRYGEEDVEYRVMLDKAYRQKLSYLKQVRIPNQQGELIALDEVASLELQPGPSVFRHYKGERTVTITGGIFQDQSTPLTVMSAVQQHFDVKRDYPGIRLDIGGEAEESRRTMLDLYITFGVAALGIYFLLMLLFNSVTQPLMVLMAIPFGICGVIVTFALHGEPFSFLGMLGVVGMTGVVVNDSLVLVDHLNSLRRKADIPLANPSAMIQIIATGTANRLRPILLTSFTTVAGLLPLAYGLGGQDIFMSPMALALGYGLLFATPLSLVLVPSFYMIGYDISSLLYRVRNYKMSHAGKVPEMLPES